MAQNEFDGYKAKRIILTDEQQNIWNADKLPSAEDIAARYAQSNAQSLSVDHRMIWP